MNEREILFVSNFLGNGGAARVITVLAESFMKSGWKVSICSFPFEGMEYSKTPGINYIILEQKGSGAGKKINRIKELRKEFKKHKDAVIVSFEYFMNMQTVIAAFGLRNKLVLSERNDPQRVGGQFPTYIIRNILYSDCDVLVNQTEDAKAYFPKYIQKKAVVIPNAVKDDLPSVYEGRRNKTIVNFCRLEKQKNLPLLIDAFEEFSISHPDYSLEIYGNGKEEEALRSYISKKKTKDKILLHKAVPDIHEKIVGSAMFVSSSDYEGISNSMLEAMAIGLPVICTDCPCGGAKMMIEDGVSGILTPVGDKDSLVRAMSRVADDRKLAEYLSRNGKEIRERYSADRITEMWKKVVN